MNDKLKEEIRKTLGILKNGGVILYPTDTIWDWVVTPLIRKLSNGFMTSKNGPTTNRCLYCWTMQGK